MRSFRRAPISSRTGMMTTRRHDLNNLEPLEGRLSHIHYVKDRRDLDSKDKKNINAQRPKGLEYLYRKFLIYKCFVASEFPVVVTEGKTDIVYLRCAIKALKEQFPILAREEGQSTRVNVHFINPTYVNQRILGLGEGFGGMKAIIERYENIMSSYNDRVHSSPVIFALDNDDGGEEVFKIIRKNTGIEIDFKASETFFHLKQNLYLVKTPSEGSDQSCMEDLFSEEVLSTLLHGKPFGRNKKHGDHTAYGKSEFADRVVRPRVGEIDFRYFAPLLNGITGSIRHFGEAVAPVHQNIPYPGDAVNS